MGFELTMLVVIGTDCIVSYKSNYHITTTTASVKNMIVRILQNIKKNVSKYYRINKYIYIYQYNTIPRIIISTELKKDKFSWNCLYFLSWWILFLQKDFLSFFITTEVEQFKLTQQFSLYTALIKKIFIFNKNKIWL